MRNSGVVVVLAGVLTGCAPDPVGKTASAPEKSSAPAKEQAKAGHDHSGWWCDEHGVPEAECSQCSGKVAAEAKKKGDWCEAHDRAKSQCFLCDPKLKGKYAAVYRAKYGKEPPATEE